MLCLTLKISLRDFQNITFCFDFISYKNECQEEIKNSKSIKKEIQPKKKVNWKDSLLEKNDTLIQYKRAQASGRFLLGKALHTWLIPANSSPQQQDKFHRK